MSTVSLGKISTTEGAMTITMPLPKAMIIDDLGMTPQQFNDAWWRAQDPRIRALRDMSYNDREKAAEALLTADPTVKLDWAIAVSEIEGTPYNTTQQRMIDGFTRIPVAKMYSGIFTAPVYSLGLPGTVNINTLPDADSLPVPPDLTPWPDPVLPKPNEFVGPVWDEARKLYVATARGWQAPEGQILQEADGHFYKRVGQLRVGDTIAQYQRLD